MKKTQDTKFIAVINDVKELRLIGNANLDFWNRQLDRKPFQAFDDGGSAEITIAATELVWKGFRFNEFMVTLAIAEKHDPSDQIGVFLLHAFNSNRLLAFCERALFSTPYYFGKVDFRETSPCLMLGSLNDRTVFKAEMSHEDRKFRDEDEHWEGAIFLPNKRGEKYFTAKLSGKSKICLFDKTDKIELQSDAKQTVFETLKASGFTGKQWRMRSDAFHAKSKTIATTYDETIEKYRT